jgi:hypothetical protein
LIIGSMIAARLVLQPSLARRPQDDGRDGGWWGAGRAAQRPFQPSFFTTPRRHPERFIPRKRDEESKGRTVLCSEKWVQRETFNEIFVLFINGSLIAAR